MNFPGKFFGKKEGEKKDAPTKPDKKTKVTAERIGELGEYKINIQLDQFPSNHKHLKDLMLKNNQSKSGFSQIDHILFTPFGIFVIETKNYTGEIAGSKTDKQWTVNKKLKMMNPFHQNYGHVQIIKRVLKLTDGQNIYSIVSFNRRAIFRVDPELRQIKSNNLCVYDTELTEYINRKIEFTKFQNHTAVFTDQEIESMFANLKAANITDRAARENHVNSLKSQIKKTDAKCAKCGIEVSEKVKRFCMSNPKFKGNIYCFEHQKS